MKKAFLILLISCISLLSAAQKVTIKGSAKYYAEKEIGAWVNTDYISNIQKKITYDTIDVKGDFLLEFNSKTIQYITLKIDKNIASLYIQPGMNYDVIIAAPDSSTYYNKNREHDVSISLKQTPKTEINSLTMDYDRRFDDFLSVDYKSFVSRTPQAKIDSFRIAMHSFYSTVSNPYFNNYIDYSIAAMEKNTKMSDKKLFATYIANKPILYTHPEYMNFFNSFYKQKLQALAMSKKGSDLFFIVDDRGSFVAAANALKRDIFVPNDTICELVLLKGLYESYYDGTFKKTGIVAILKQMTTESKVEEHKLIAQNILNSFSKLQKGTIAPGFELPDKTGLTHSLDELRTKKYVYVTFFDKECSACMEQMKVISSLKKTYGERIEFVSISTDKSNTELKNFQLKNPKYDWLFVYDNTGGQLKKEYEIISMPAYFLIGPDGKFVRVPAESPEGDIEQVFYDLTKVRSKLHGVGDKQNR